MAAASSPAEVLSAEIPESLTEEFAELGLDDFDFSELQQDEAVQEALRKGTQLDILPKKELESQLHLFCTYVDLARISKALTKRMSISQEQAKF